MLICIGEILVDMIGEPDASGDAFFGCLLARLDSVDLKTVCAADLDDIFFAANKCGAMAATACGAIDPLPTYEQVFGE